MATHIPFTDNYEDLWNYGMDLLDEHYHRFGSRNTHTYRHGSEAAMERLQNLPPIAPTEKHPCPLLGYEGYKESGPFMAHSHREIPEWLN